MSEKIRGYQVDGQPYLKRFIEMEIPDGYDGISIRPHLEEDAEWEKMDDEWGIFELVFNPTINPSRVHRQFGETYKDVFYYPAEGAFYVEELSLPQEITNKNGKSETGRVVLDRYYARFAPGSEIEQYFTDQSIPTNRAQSIRLVSVNDIIDSV